MKQAHKQYIRSLIIELLYDEDIRHKLPSFIDKVQNKTGDVIDEFEAMEFYEQEVERINKLFCYPSHAEEVIP